MNERIEWDLTPAQLLQAEGVKFRQRSSWLAVKVCPFCSGGDHADKDSFAVHAVDGNYICKRSKCGVESGFWQLLEHFGRDPRDHIKQNRERRGKAKNAKPKKRFVYGR